MHLHEEILERETIFEGKVFTVVKDVVKLEDGGKSYRELVLHNGGAGILPIWEDGTVTLVKQYRSGVASQMVEICAGKLEKGENPIDAAVRELEEELGIVADKIEFLGDIAPTPAYDSEIISIYVATGLRQKERKLDEGEFVDVATLSLNEAAELVMDGEITDAKTQIAILKAVKKYGKN